MMLNDLVLRSQWRACRKRYEVKGVINLEKVKGYRKRVHGRMVQVKGYFRKNHDKVSAHDRSVDRRNAKKARRDRR